LLSICHNFVLNGTYISQAKMLITPITGNR